MPDSLINNLNRRMLLELAGERSFERGENYFDEERVRSLVEFEGMLAATVEGTEDYRVKLMVGSSGLSFSCECPYADEGNFCKHCVAVGLAWLAQRDAQTGSGEGHAAGIAGLNGARAFLEKQDKAALVEMILREALDNERACARLIEAAQPGKIGRKSTTTP
jgi:uncharacterized Zn finger protein